MVNKIFLTIISTLAVLFYCFELLLIYDEIGSIPTFILICMLIINIIPIIFLLFIHFLSKKFNWKKVVNILVNIFLLICNFLYFLFIGFGSIGVLLFWDTTPRIPKQENYTKSLYKIQSEYQNNKFNHFPETLPENITDYDFFIENSFDGEDTHYLKFKTNPTYVNKELQEKCNNKTVSKESVSNRFYTNKFSEAEEFCIIHKSKQEELYSTGIATNKDHNIIYYFYANY